MKYRIDHCVNCGPVENTMDISDCPVCGLSFNDKGVDISSLTSKVADILDLKVKEYEVKHKPKSPTNLWLAGAIVAFFSGHPWIAFWSFMNWRR